MRSIGDIEVKTQGHSHIARAAYSFGSTAASYNRMVIASPGTIRASRRNNGFRIRQLIHRCRLLRDSQRLGRVGGYARTQCRAQVAQAVLDRFGQALVQRR